MSTLDEFQDLRGQAMGTEKGSGCLDRRRALYDLCSNQGSSDEFCGALSSFFSDFGEIQRISSFNAKGKGSYFLVGFVLDTAAVKAANSTGCSMFGFNTVLVPLKNAAESPCLQAGG